MKSKKLGVTNASGSVLKDKTYSFALRIVKLSQYLRNEKMEYILSKQVLRSGTAIGALVREAEYGQSKVDFVHKLSIALKEGNETDFWISILRDSDYIDTRLSESLLKDCSEIMYILISSIKTAKKSAE